MNKKYLLLIEVIIILFLIVLLIVKLNIFYQADSELFITKSDNIILAYEYKTDIRVHHYNINADGFRDSVRNFEKTSKRILIIGDSITGGYGSDIVFNKILEELYLNNSQNIEVMSLAVEGYNAVQEIELLELLGLKYSPDIVILQSALNDLEDHNLEMVLSDSQILKRDKSLEEKYGFNCRSEKESASNYVEDFYISKFSDDCHPKLLSTLYSRFKYLAEENNFKPYILITPYDDPRFNIYADLFIETALTNDIYLINLVPDLNDHSLFLDVMHPNNDGHKIIAKKLFEEIII